MFARKYVHIADPDSEIDNYENNDDNCTSIFFLCNSFC